VPEAARLHIATGKRPEFLTTKVVPPRWATGLIERPRLLGLIAQVETIRACWIFTSTVVGS